MFYKVVSFFTGDGYYEECAKRLQASLDFRKRDYHIERIADTGNYFSNTRQKPAFIRHMMSKYNKPILWVDADTIIDKDYFDIPIRQNDIALGYGPSKYGFFSHWMMFNNTDIAKSLLDEWDEACQNTNLDYTGDHSALAKIIKERKKETYKVLKIHELTNFPPVVLAPTNQVPSKRRI